MRLADLVSPIFLFVATMRRKIKRGVAVDYGDVQREALQLFNRVEAQASSRGMTDGWTRAKVPLAYLVDEIAIMETWSGADTWNNHSLEIEYLHHTEKMRGVWFFDRQYKEAIEGGDVDMIEVLYVCMSLGFEGKLRGQTAQIKNHIDNLYARLAIPYREDQRDEKMYPAAYVVDPTANDPKLPMRITQALAILLTITVLYFVMNTIMYNRFVDRLREIVATLGNYLN